MLFLSTFFHFNPCERPQPKEVLELELQGVHAELVREDEARRKATRELLAEQDKRGLWFARALAHEKLRTSTTTPINRETTVTHRARHEEEIPWIPFASTCTRTPER
ncbi:MAG TPA: hypothetical protein VFF76_00325 [Holophagaceae bacterium]|jgi:hypothetical protein|nr:hypothetical protein [Holophagaceae bacterium]